MAVRHIPTHRCSCSLLLHVYEKNTCIIINIWRNNTVINIWESSSVDYRSVTHATSAFHVKKKVSLIWRCFTFLVGLDSKSSDMRGLYTLVLSQVRVYCSSTTVKVAVVYEMVSSVTVWITFPSPSSVAVHLHVSDSMACWVHIQDVWLWNIQCHVSGKEGCKLV